MKYIILASLEMLSGITLLTLVAMIVLGWEE